MPQILLVVSKLIINDMVGQLHLLESMYNV